jgi:hypothetical protein
MTWTRGDKILITVMALLNLALLYQLGFNNTQGSFVLVEVDQQEVVRAPLSTERVLHIAGKLGETEVEIRDGVTRILRSPCKNKVCIKTGYIRYADRMAACIPNGVVVRVIGASHREVDTVVG